MSENLIDLARRKGRRLATAESCTGGLVAAALTDIPGASDVFDRGFVTYSNAAKTDMLGVDAALLDHHGAVSQAVARAMADGALARSKADMAVSITGIAGPGGGSLVKPIGMVWFALAQKGIDTIAICHQFGDLGRDLVRLAARDAALTLFYQALADRP